jgi:hypothetical protein
MKFTLFALTAVIGTAAAGKPQLSVRFVLILKNGNGFFFFMSAHIHSSVTGTFFYLN